MGSDNPPNNDLNLQKNTYSAQGLGVPRQQMNQFRQRLYSDPYDRPDDSEKLQPIRRHSNINDSISFNNQLSKGAMPHNSSKTIPTNIISQSNSSELPSLAEKNRTRKMSQQYCADFKKSYLSEGTGTKNRFLNHLADRLNYGTQIPKEEIEKFKQEYLPKYVFDWRNVDDPRTGVKYWKNFGKIYFDKNFEIKMKKLGDTPIGASEPFYFKRSWFYRHLMRNFIKNKNENPLVFVNRNNILEDSYNQFQKIQSINIARPLKIRFINEQIVDEEGVYREWYQCMFKELLSPQKKLFVLNPYKSLEPNTWLFYPKYPGMKLELYEFIGKLMIKVIADIINVRNLIFNRVLLKSVLRRPITLDDMKYYNLDLYQKLKYINDNQIRGNKQLETIRFVWNIKGPNNTIKEIELVQGGKNIFLNDNNKITFIDKVIYVEAIMPYDEQIKYTQKGLFSILEQDVRGIFSVEELNFLMTGQENIDLNDWKENTIYKGAYNPNHPVIKMFWDKIGTLQKNELIKFLEFSTGTGSVQIDGFGSLKGVGGRIQKFTIEPFTNYSAENPDIYTFHRIEAKRVYNTIILPEYRSRQELDQAINMILYNK
jgi:hypothetical protein